MDISESVLFFVFILYVLYFWGSYYAYLLQVNGMLYQRRDMLLLAFTPLLCSLGLLIVLRFFADTFVRISAIYIAFYLLGGLAWLGLGLWLLPFLGFSLRDDGLERRNTAATIALCGAFIGITAAYAGGNIGNGPGWWVVLYCVLFSTGSFFLLWLVLEFYTQISETITIERNVAAGLRLAVILIVQGLILGRAVTGDWHGLSDLVTSFLLRAWYVIPLLVVAIRFEWSARPSIEQPNPSVYEKRYSLYPIIAYVLIVVIALLLPIPGSTPL